VTSPRLKRNGLLESGDFVGSQHRRGSRASNARPETAPPREVIAMMLRRLRGYWITAVYPWAVGAEARGAGADSRVHCSQIREG
jgi:hypothetical protein